MTKVINIRTSNYSDIDIGRPGPWGNPFSHLQTSIAEHKTASRAESIAAFRNWVVNSNEPKAIWIREHLEELRDKTLGCWCKPLPCHGDIYIELLKERKEALKAPRLSPQEQELLAQHITDALDELGADLIYRDDLCGFLQADLDEIKHTVLTTIMKEAKEWTSS